jgi:16S rRNA (uracil1498-N3)-methyltransferase
LTQIFIESSDICDDCITVTGDAARHLKVLRPKKNETVRAVCASNGVDYLCEIAEIRDDDILLKIVDVEAASRELPVRITIYQGMPKADKLEFVIQKSVEMGAVSIVPVLMKRSIVRLDEAKATKKLDRWNSIARSAAEQSKRTVIPDVKKPVSFKEAVIAASEDDAILLPYELTAVGKTGDEDVTAVSEQSSSMSPVADRQADDRSTYSDMEQTRKLLTALKEKGVSSLSVVIGPEGGFDPSEVEAAVDAGAHIITLGRRILRTETAPIAILAWLTYIFEE